MPCCCSPNARGTLQSLFPTSLFSLPSKIYCHHHTNLTLVPHNNHYYYYYYIRDYLGELVPETVWILLKQENFGRILHRFRDTAAQRSKNRFFALPTLLWGPTRGTPSEFLDETYPAEARGMGLLYGENWIILSSNAFDWSTRVTDGRTDGIAMAYTRYSIYAVARKNCRRHTDTLRLVLQVWDV